jgi:hypothetical protein
MDKIKKINIRNKEKRKATETNRILSCDDKNFQM